MNAVNDAPGNRVVRKFRVRAILFLAAALIAGGAAVFLVKVYLDQVRETSTAAPIETVAVVVAANNLPIASRLEPNHLMIARWPAEFAPAGAFQRPEDVVGQTLRQAIVAGEPILRDRLADKSRGQGLAAILEEGARAMAVKVDQVVGIAGFVQPGDYVDVISTITPDDETRSVLGSKAARMSKIILQNIKVLAVGEHMATDGRKPVKVQVVTLEVQPDESERLALASQHGSVQLTMRSRVDQQSVPTSGVTPLVLLSPDDEAPARVAQTPATTESERAERRRPRRARPRAERAPRPQPVAQAAPKAPVIEILRGPSSVEERKLRPVGGK